MAERAQDGGPAFPQSNEQRYNDPVHGVIRPSDIYGEAHPGMSLRDYFAGQALAGLLAHSHDGGHSDMRTPLSYGRESIAVEAYGIADAMLAAREADRG